MKYLTILFLIITTLSCQMNKKHKPILGTWNKCFKDGEYMEYIITEDYMLLLTTQTSGIGLFSNKIENNTLIMSGINVSSLNDVDTLFITSLSKDKLILNSKWKIEIELNKIDNIIYEIDSTNIEKWEKQTIAGFTKRAALMKCPDLRTEKEKILPNLGNVDYQEEELEYIPVDLIKDSIK